MKIILEGAKGTGKTTLAKKLMKQYNLEYHHSTAETKNDLEYHVGLINDPRDLLLDRFQIGEVIYSQFYHRKPKLTLREMEMLSDLRTDVVTIVLYASRPYSLFSRIREREGFLIPEVAAECRFANEHFRVLGGILQQYNKNVIMIDTSDKNAEMVYKEVIGELSRINA